MKKMQHCFNCGDECGIFEAHWRDIITCGKRECERAAVEVDQQMEAYAFEAAREDHFDRYR